MNAAPDTSVIVAAVALIIGLAWLAACALIAVMGGWRRLAGIYRTVPAPGGEIFRFASMSIGGGLFPARYRNSLTVTVGPTGIGLSVIILFRLLHPPVFIPWSDVVSARREQSWLKHHVAVTIQGFDKPLHFSGRAGAMILETYRVRTHP